jgi:hypothetical protein
MNYDGPETYIDCISNGAVNLYHNNSNKFQTTSTGVHVDGELIIDGSVGDIKLNSSGAEIDFNRNGPCNLIMSGSGVFNILGGTPGSADTLAKFTPNGSVELYYNNSKKFETRDAGATLFGDLYMGDDKKIRLGDGSGGDLRLYHDGSNSYIQHSVSGNLRYQSNNHDFYNQAASQFMCRMFNGDTVRLYHNGSARFETTGAGAKVTGDGEVIRMEGADNDTFIKLLGSSNVNVIFGHLNDQGFVGNSTNHDFFIRTNNTNRISISNSGTLSGDLNDTSDGNLKENIVAISDGAISDIKKLRPVNFDWKDSEKAKNQSGFIAQEVKTIFPDLVVGEEYDESNEESFGFAINTSGVVAHLTKALQEAITKIETLETKVAALEAA